MTDQPAPDSPAMAGAPIGFVEFVALVAALMSLTALGIDSMLPALPSIGAALGVADENHRQFVVTAFVVGFGVAQLIHGPLADRFGRRRVLLISLAGYAFANAAAALAGSFALLLTARVIGGGLIAATRVATVALVRDCYHGRAMAQVMSIAFMVFMIVPILAPAFGQTVLLFADWRGIFWAITVATTLVFAWFWWRMPETLKPADVLPISAARIVGGWRLTVSDRWSLGYTLASGMLLGALYGYLNSVQQIMTDTFHHGRWLAAMFAATSFLMAVANLTNARLVMRLGTRLISHSALVTLIVLSSVHLALAVAGIETLATFVALQALTMACFGLATSNFSAMAMENMGHIAGTASSVQGFVSVLLGSAIGVVIGQAFDGTTRPLETGFVVCGTVALAIVTLTERGRLFRAA